MKKLVWDTSSLSHALEGYSHSAVSAYMASKRKVWSAVKELLKRRHKSEYTSRMLLADCNDSYVCLAPTEIVKELYRSPTMRDEISVLLDDKKIFVERRYGKNARGFADVFKPDIKSRSPSYEAVRIARDAMRKLRLKVSDQDLNAIALAYEEGATLVTADRRMKEIAEYLGVDVIFTIPEEAKEEVKIPIPVRLKFKMFRVFE